MKCPFKVRRPITSSVARRACAVSSRGLPPPERQSPQWRSRACHANAGYALEATARTSPHGLAPKERGLPPVQCPFVVRGATAASAARRAHAASLRVLQPSETQPAQWRSRVGHAKGGCALEVTARTSHHGLAPKERGLPPVQCPFVLPTPITISAVRRARAVSLRVSPPRERQPVQWRLRACHANAGCALQAIARTSHHGLAPKERGLPPVKCRSIAHRPIVTSAARCARCKLATFANSQETASAVAPVRVPRECRCTLEATVRKSHHGLAPEERGLPPVQYPSMACEPIITSAAQSARGAS